MKQFLMSVMATSLTAITFSGAAFGQSNPCPDQPITPPASDTRPYQNADYGFSFQIPTNYRAVRFARSSSIVEVIDPAGYEIGQCLRRAVERNPGLASDNGPLPIFVDARLSKGTLSLMDNIRETSYSDVDVIREITVAGQPAIVYQLEALIFNIPFTQISFFTPDQRNIITITEGPGLDAAFETVLSSFTFGD